MRLVQAGAFVATMTSSSALAFCGFYVAGADTQLFNEATTVVMMRHGTTTVLSMQNDYKGPPEDFAMVVPVPEVLEEDNVRTLQHHVFSRIDQMAAPRLVEYWEQDPCARPRSYGRGGGRSRMIRRAAPGAAAPSFAPRPPVRIEAEFSVEEYDIVILSADDSSSLETWLAQNGYNIPEGAAAALRPYVEQDMKFFVAKVDTEKVRWEGTGRHRHAVLSPLRMHYNSDEFSLPVRLGMLNSAGTQDLIVHVLAEAQRYEVANMPNVTIPTIIVVEDATRRRFGSFYAALFDRTIAETGAVVTEYSWQASTCDPCPGPTLTNEDLSAVGGDVLPFEDVPPPPSLSWQSTIEIEHTTLPVTLSEKANVTGALRECHQQTYHQQRSNAVAGRVRLEVSSDGLSRSVGIVANTLPAEHRAAFETCLTEHTAAIQLWKPPVQPQNVGSGTMDVLLGAAGRMAGNRAARLRNLVLTRLHYRYDRDDLADDLVFRPAPPILGGRGTPRGRDSDLLDDLLGERPDTSSELDSTVREGSVNNFQGRYAILHSWTGPIRCASPRHGRWGGPTRQIDRPAVRAARNLGHVTRGGVRLDRLIAAASLPVILPTPQVAPDYGSLDDEGRDLALPPLPVVHEASATALPQAAPESGGCAGGCACSSANTDGNALPLLLWFAFRKRGRRIREEC